ncbi:hypothetical protein KAW48_00115 [candidate division WOR-3 bacterium]|nr:hypothetical protein [candidate division WOR-3 bacterium]
MESGNVEEVNEIRKKVRRVWWEDGLVEIVAGMWFLLLGAISFIYRLPFNPIIKIVVLVLLIVFNIFLPRWLKAKYVWKDTGYSMPAFFKLYTWPYVIFLVLALLSLLGLFFSPSRLNGLLFGFFFCFIFLGTFSLSGLRRFLIMSTIPFVVGLLGAIFKLSLGKNLYLMVLVVGIALLISGVRVYSEFKKKVYNEG